MIKQTSLIPAEPKKTISINERAWKKLNTLRIEKGKRNVAEVVDALLFGEK